MAIKRRPKRAPDAVFHSENEYEKVEIWFKDDLLISSTKIENWKYSIQRWTSKKSAMWTFFILSEYKDVSKSIDWDVDFWRLNDLESKIETAYKDWLATKVLEEMLKVKDKLKNRKSKKVT